MYRFLSVLMAIIICMVPLFTVVSAEETNGTASVAVIKQSETEYVSYISALAEKDANEEIKISADVKIDKNAFTAKFEAYESGLYTIGLNYRALDNQTSDLSVGIKIDGEYPFEEASRLVFPRIWRDKESVRKDNNGNTYTPEQIIFENFYFSEAIDISGWSSDVYKVYISKGVHNVTVISSDGSFELSDIVFGIPEKTEAYSEPVDEKMNYQGEPIVIEAEDAYIKTSNSLGGKSDLFSSSVTPNSPMHSMVNYIGGSNWKEAGETIVWKIKVPQDGYYSLGFSFRQSEIINGNCYRHLKIDGKTPFTEANKLAFPHDDNWQYTVWQNEENKPYLIYLSKGEHELSLSATLGDMTRIIAILNNTVSDTGDLYRDITMITGETVDTYRDYDLFTQIPDLENRLEKTLTDLKNANSLFEEIAGHSSGSYTSVINGMIRTVEKMLEKKYSAHRHISSYYSGYSSLSASLTEMRNMPLDIDKIILYSPDEKDLLRKDGFISGLWFSLCRFVSSFATDYNTIGDNESADKSLTVWVNWGRDQAQIFNSMLNTSFTPKTDISVELKVVNATVIQALLSGDGPDCILQHSRTEPVNLAMRGALYDLSQFDDCDEVLERFSKGADIPYRYLDGLYALPDTQSFYMMFYRTDVFEEFGFEIPENWEEFEETAMLLIKNNLSVYMPYTQITDMSVVNSGVGTLSLFPTLVLQNDLSLYSENGRATSLSEPEIISVFKNYTDFYTKLRVPTTMSFFNRFRSGTAPLGIDNYTLYTTIQAAAPEINGRWSMAPIPGTVREDGSVSSVSAAGGTACAILNISKNKNEAWELLKWWTSAETQLAYSNNVESVLGPTGRVSVSNTEALYNMSWKNGMKEQLIKARSQIKEIPEYPGSYYLSRALDHSFWNVVNSNKQPKDMLTTWGKEADDEIERKWAQYEK